jgi:hypothetical protein
LNEAARVHHASRRGGGGVALVALLPRPRLKVGKSFQNAGEQFGGLIPSVRGLDGLDCLSGLSLFFENRPVAAIVMMKVAAKGPSAFSEQIV